MTPIRTLCLALALALTSLTPSAAQGLPETPQQQKDREFALVFQEGLYALTNREVPRAIQLFQRHQHMPHFSNGIHAQLGP